MARARRLLGTAMLVDGDLPLETPHLPAEGKTKGIEGHAAIHEPSAMVPRSQQASLMDYSGSMATPNACLSLGCGWQMTSHGQSH